MKTKDAIRFFGSRVALAKTLGIRVQSTYSWGKTVPALRQLQIERITRGALVAAQEITSPGRG